MGRVNSLRVLAAIAAFVTAAILFTGALAHPGRTDDIGGHYDSTVGEYHYHHGHEAHQHIDGVCPYGDYDEWLATHVQEAEAETLANAARETSQEASGPWEEIGIGVGAAAAVSAIGYGVYRKTKKKQAAQTRSGEAAANAYDPHMIVYVASNGNRYHKTCGCCNALQPVELEEALKDSREACPICYNEELAAYTVTPDGNEQIEINVGNTEVTVTEAETSLSADEK